MFGKKSVRVSVFAVCAALVLFCASPLLASGGGASQENVISGIGIAILAATVMAFIGHKLKQPLLLAYIVAGVIIGPEIGFGFISNVADVETISHIGLLLLLFLIGLEIDIKKLRQAGKSLVIGGVSQVPLCIALGMGFFLLMGFTLAPGKYDLLYLAACLSMSSTAIVVKLLYGKFELDTLAGRITLGILVFQDIWAIVLLGIQPNLTNPNILQILLSFGKGFLLVGVSMLISKFILPKLFKTIAKVPELVLISSLGWCFLVCGAASFLGISVEMGALIAGISISTFPYNLDVIAKVVNIRDFFVTLFFVSLGMKIPNPLADLSVLIIAAVASLFLVASRLLSVFPVLYSMKNGLRVSLLTSINLSQISEFSLVIASMGLAAGHIGRNTLSIIIFVFVITSILSTYLINYSDPLQKFLSSVLKKIGLRDIQNPVVEEAIEDDKEIALLGFYRTASSFLNEIIRVENETDRSIRDKVVVVDFNPEIRESLQAMGVKVVYGDIGHLDTLQQSGIQNAKIVISTIPDTILVGTDNLKIIKHMKDICPQAKIIVTAESIERALRMYAEGADYVLVPRVLSAHHLKTMVQRLLSDNPQTLAGDIRKEIELMRGSTEIIR